jgi:hypothetical protein
LDRVVIEGRVGRNRRRDQIVRKRMDRRLKRLEVRVDSVGISDPAVRERVLVRGLETRVRTLCDQAGWKGFASPPQVDDPRWLANAWS